MRVNSLFTLTLQPESAIYAALVAVYDTPPIKYLRIPPLSIIVQLSFTALSYTLDIIFISF